MNYMIPFGYVPVVKRISQQPSKLSLGVQIPPGTSLDAVYNHSIYFGYMKTLLSIKTDVDVKRKVKKIAEELGLPLSTIINAYLRQLLRERRVDFSLPLVPNKKTAKSLRQAHNDFKKGKNISPIFESPEEMDAWLNA